ncbi:E3 ubiquitin-protein ligase sina-like [Diabrotica undecimpunctata]|uniref:E3 ubiquitin-protein ligase sina-like n=1 Tax=Diabrotica undecimpunctata TaxID=50387 RepID=UPI003B637B67
MAEQSLLNFMDELLESSCLFCAVCKDILKPPIMLVENVGNICRKCYEEKQEIMHWKSMNNSALENVLKLLKLPCKYKTKGCAVRVSYEDLDFHQNGCKYRTKVCSMFKFGCDWEGSTIDFIEHFKECHGDHVINFENNLFFLETSLSDTNMVKLLVMKQHTFILRMQTNLRKNKLFYIICSVHDDDYSSFCEYSVKHKGGSENYIKTKSKIVSSYHIYNEFDESIAMEIDLDALKQISHISDTITNIFKIKLEESSGETIDDKILHFFECPVCKNFMKPPIFQCSSGHSICNMCRPRLEKCPTCRSAFGNTRNYSLEGLTAGVQYPCVYHDSGCLEIGSANHIVKHESECSFKPYSCPFPTCTSNGNHEVIVQHLINFHFDSVIYCGSTSYTDSFRLDQNNCYNKIFDRKCIITCNHIFRITCRRVAEHCLMAAEIVGSKNDLKTFVYEVSIIDMRRPEKKLIRTDYCLNEMPEDELFKKCIMFPNSVLSSYSNHGMVTFNVAIKEK